MRIAYGRESSGACSLDIICAHLAQVAPILVLRAVCIVLGLLCIEVLGLLDRLRANTRNSSALRRCDVEEKGNLCQKATLSS